jgi:hypothetical protein
MAHTELRAMCDSLNDHRGRGGQTRLARLLGWDYLTLWRKINRKSQITQSDELAIRHVVRALYHEDSRIDN